MIRHPPRIRLKVFNPRFLGEGILAILEVSVEGEGAKSSRLLATVASDQAAPRSEFFISRWMQTFID